MFGVGIGDGEDEPPCCCPSVGVVVGHKTSAGSPTTATATGNGGSGQSTPNSASGSPPTVANGNGGGSPLVLGTANREIEKASARIVVGTCGLGSRYSSINQNKCFISLWGGVIIRCNLNYVTHVFVFLSLVFFFLWGG